jgi:hypothetical protein
MEKGTEIKMRDFFDSHALNMIDRFIAEFKADIEIIERERKTTIPLTHEEIMTILKELRNQISFRLFGEVRP